MYRHARTHLLFLLMLLLAFDGCSNPQNAPAGDLVLLVLGVGDVPVAGIRVTLSPGDLHANTGTDGRALFAGIAVGDYEATISDELYETATASCTVEDGVRSEQTVHLTGHPGSLEISTLRGGLPFNGGSVKVRDPADGSLLFSGQVLINGKVTAEGLPAGLVEVSVDTMENEGGPTVEANVLPLQTIQVSVAIAPFASLFKGSAGFGSTDLHEVGLFETNSAGTSLSLLETTTSFTGTYSVMTDVHGYLGTAVYGNPVDLDYAIMLSPFYDATSDYRTAELPWVNGRLARVSPTDDTPYYTSALPIQFICTYPTVDCLGAIWDVFYWTYENGGWNWTLAYSSPLQEVRDYFNWNGEYSTDSPLYGQPLHAAPEGSEYSWSVSTGYATGYVCVTWDYFFTLADTSSGVAMRTSLPARRQPDQETVLKAMLEHARQADRKLLRVLPPAP